MLNALREIDNAPVPQRRALNRYTYNAACQVQCDGQPMLATICDISAGGLSLRLDSLVEISVGETVTLVIDDFQPIDAAVRWSTGTTYGLQFLSSVQLHPELSLIIEELEAA